MADTTQLNTGEFALTCFRRFLEHFEIGGMNGNRIEEVVNRVHDGIALSLEESVGGGEGDGEYVSRVYGLTVGDKILAHVRVTGFYSSYDGTTWDDTPHIVYPHRVTVTQFKGVPQ